MSESFPSLTQTTSETTGTANLVLSIANLSGDIAYLRTPKQAVAHGDLTDGDIVFYNVVDKEQDGNALFEVGSGIYDDTANTIARTAANVISGRNGPGVLVSLPLSGVRDVLILDHIPRVSSRIDVDDVFRIAENGDIGIRTATPSTTLHIQENSTVSLPIFAIQQLGTGDASMQFSVVGDAFAVGIDNDGANKFKISYANATLGAAVGVNDRFVIDVDGNVGINNSSPSAQLDVDGDTILNSAGTDNDTQIKGLTDDDLLFVDAGNDRIGISTSTPAATLDVDGDVRVRASFTTDGNVDFNLGAGEFFKIDTNLITSFVTVDGDDDRMTIGSNTDHGELFGVEGAVAIKDGMTAPTATAGFGKLYIDTADGNLKFIFASGTIKTIATDP